MASVINDIDTSNLASRLESEFQLPRLAWDEMVYNRTATAMRAQELVDAGVPSPLRGFRWNAEDGATSRWVPQGITGLRRAGRRCVVVSWYGEGDSKAAGVRLSFVDVTDMSKIRYRSVLAVQPASGMNGSAVFAPVKIHAGGLATRGTRIYMADSGRGMRIFDANRIFRVSSDATQARCGIAGGKAHAFDFRYVIPQEHLVEMDQDGTRFSFCTMDWSGSEPRLLTGNYHVEGHSKYHNPPAMLAWWKLNGTKIVGCDATLVWNVQRAQGAQAVDGTLLVSRGGKPATLRVGPPASFPKGAHVHDWPQGCEDLHHSKYARTLWCLTEHVRSPGRFVFAVKASSFVP